MLAARDEKHSMLATLWFNIAHYGLRPWPWIIVGLASLLVYPTLADIQQAFPHLSPDLIGHDIAYPAMLVFLPAGFKGIMVASLAAAYLSTMDTSLNWGASYLVHDFYRRFIRTTADERHYVMVSRLVTTGTMIISALIMFLLVSARESFDLLLSIGAGTGLLYILRWFWWRINAWSEIAAMLSSFVISLGLFLLRKSGFDLNPQAALITNVILTTMVWLTVTFLTRPTDQTTLVSFYKLVRPMGRGWERIRNLANLPPSPDSLPHAFLGWTLGCISVYSALFAAGSFLYGKISSGIMLSIPFLLSSLLLIRLIQKIFNSSKGRIE